MVTLLYLLTFSLHKEQIIGEVVVRRSIYTIIIERFADLVFEGHPQL